MCLYSSPSFPHSIFYNHSIMIETGIRTLIQQLTSSQPSVRLSQLSHQCTSFRSQTAQPRISHCADMSPSSPPIWNSPSVFVFHDHTFGPLFCRMFLTLGAPGVFFMMRLSFCLLGTDTTEGALCPPVLRAACQGHMPFTHLIPGEMNFDRLDVGVPIRFIHCTVTIFPLAMSKCLVGR